MNTHAHAGYTWLIARRAMGVGPDAALAAAAGAALPDLPYIGKAVYLVARHRRALTRERFLDEMDYVRPPSWIPDLALHSLIPVVTLLAADRAWSRASSRERVLPWFLAGWVGHNIVDLGTHSGDARPHFWPLSAWRWRSPVSYWDPEHHALAFLLVENGPIVALGLRRLLRRHLTATGWRRAAGRRARS